MSPMLLRVAVRVRKMYVRNDVHFDFVLLLRQLHTDNVQTLHLIRYTVVARLAYKPIPSSSSARPHPAAAGKRLSAGFSRSGQSGRLVLAAAPGLAPGASLLESCRRKGSCGILTCTGFQRKGDETLRPLAAAAVFTVASDA